MQIHEAFHILRGLPWWLRSKEPACNAGDEVISLVWEEALEEGMATHSSIRAWGIPTDSGAWWARRVRHNFATKPPSVINVGNKPQYY